MNELLGSAIVPILITIIYVLFYVSYRKDTVSARELTSRIDKFVPHFKNAVKGMRIEFSKPTEILLVSFFSVLILDIILILVFKKQLYAYGEPLWFALIVRVVFNPISEEVIYRGFYLGIFSFMIIRTLKQSDVYFIPFLLLTSLIFMRAHHGSLIMPDITRFLHGLLYGTLYLLSNRNLAIPITAHAINNLLIILEII